MQGLLKLEKPITNIAQISIALSVFLTMNTYAETEVYKHIDEHGNVVFTDSPDTVVDAEREYIPDVNVADSVEAPSAGHSVSEQTESGNHGSNVHVIPNSHNQRVEGRSESDDRDDDVDGNYEYYGDVWREEERKKVGDAAPRRRVEDAEQRNAVRYAEPRHKVGDAEQRNQVRYAEPRHKVGDAEQRNEVRYAEPRHKARDMEQRR